MMMMMMMMMMMKKKDLLVFGNEVTFEPISYIKVVYKININII